MLFGAKRRIGQLEDENTQLRDQVVKQKLQADQSAREIAELKQWLERLDGLEAVQISQGIISLRRQASELAQQVGATKAELTAARERQAAELAQQISAAQAELAIARQQVVETREMALLQEVGIYEYRHPLQDAVAYRSELYKLSDAIKVLAKTNQAIIATTDWSVNGSSQQGAKMVRDLGKLMLRAYNAEADNAVRTLRPYALDSAISRLDKARETIAKLGAVMSMRVAGEYHRLRCLELELTADYLVKAEEEKQRLREERARQREEEKVMREIEAERRRLEKEQTHYQTALARLRERHDEAGIADLEAKLAEIDAAMTGLDDRAANIRAGYVYVISNFGSFGDSIVKIGLTRRLDPLDRVRELGDASVPFNFDVHAILFSDDAVGLETRLHQRFAAQRVNLVNLRREYFYVTPTQVRDALVELGASQVLEFHEVPEAEEWRASGGPRRAHAALPTDVKQEHQP